MAIFKLSSSARMKLAACIEIGLEGAPCGTMQENADINAIGRILDELQESEADETVIHIAPTPLYEREFAGDTSIPAGTYDEETGRAIAYEPNAD